jgi:hypothetical protein
MRERWEDWMMCEVILDRKAKNPLHKQVADWLVDAYMTIPEQLGWNAWVKSGYE